MSQDPILSRLLSYLDASPTPNHAVATTASQLQSHGFEAVDLGAPSKLFPPGFRGYLAKSGSIIAFRVGSKPVEQAGFRILSAHTDSPNLRIKPQPAMRSHGYLRLGVEVYGGALQATWADRDLGIAGQVTVKDRTGFRIELVNLDRPLCRIPNIAIHLNRKVNTEGLVLNAQTHLPALFSLDTEADTLRELLGAELGVPGEDILTWDLSLYDLTPASLLGADQAFLASARLDNLASCHAGLEGLIASLNTETASTSVLALFDHEEIGSRTARGADSPTLEDVLNAILLNTGSTSPLSRALAHTWLISADMAHAVHPAYPDKHDGEHMPHIGKGPVIKTNANQRYGTEGETAAMFQLLCESVDSPWQWFVNRSDLSCGSTVGPILAGRLGVRTVDVGNPMLSMHSAREMCGSADHAHMAHALTAFFSRENLS